MEQGIVFNDMVSKLANNTNATADMIKEALHAPDEGEVVAITQSGGYRRKGLSIAPDDRLVFKQKGFRFT